jgi:hypothetical protein
MNCVLAFQKDLAAKGSELVKLQSNHKQQLAMKDAGMAQLKAQLRLVWYHSYLHVIAVMSL